MKMVRQVFIIIALLIAGLGPAFGQSVAPDAGVQITASSGNAAGTTAATLAAAVGNSAPSADSRSALLDQRLRPVVNGTITNVISGTMTFTYTSAAGATLANTPLVVPFTPCIPPATPNTTLAVSLPSLGAGNANASVSAWGFQR